MTGETALDSHRAARERLRTALKTLADRFPPEISATPRFLCAKLACFGLVREIMEIAEATLNLVGSNTPRAAYATARGAFEAFQDLFFIVFSESPELTGASAFVGDLVDNRITFNKANAVALVRSDTIRAIGPDRGNYRRRGIAYCNRTRSRVDLQHSIVADARTPPMPASVPGGERWIPLRR